MWRRLHPWPAVGDKTGAPGRIWHILQVTASGSPHLPPSGAPHLTALAIADPPDAWRALGFAVASDGGCRIGEVTLALGGAGRGITGWRVEGAPGLADALGLDVGDAAGAPGSGGEHPNGALGLDHVVVAVPDFDGVTAALEGIGLPFRRVRQASGTVRQGFRRLGPVILEVVEAPGTPRASLWGLVAIAPDLDALVTLAAPHVKPPRAAVQPGRRIAPVSRSAGLSTQLAFMDPEPAPPRESPPETADRS